MTMKKIFLALASTALLATPVLACPNHDEAPASGPKTAEKKPADTKPATTATTKQTPAQATTKPADKPADKVSSR